MTRYQTDFDKEESIKFGADVSQKRLHHFEITNNFSISVTLYKKKTFFF